jgi:(p)ppGpp synthase/HD superfamily hydrolase
MPLHKIKQILSYAETHESFFNRVDRYYSRFSPEYSVIERAYEDAQHAFVEMYRDEGSPYFTHVRAVAIILIEYLFIFERMDLKIAAHKIIATALIHDNVEDRPDIWTLERVARDYGRDVAWLLDYVSKRPKADFDGDVQLQRDFYHSRFDTAPVEFFLVKLPDRLHNQMTLWSCDVAKIRNKILETQKYYIPWARKWGILAHELEATTDNFEVRLQQHMKQCNT